MLLENSQIKISSDLSAISYVARPRQQLMLYKTKPLDYGIIFKHD
jgi:hypothetical protein